MEDFGSSEGGKEGCGVEKWSGSGSFAVFAMGGPGARQTAYAYAA